MNNVYIKPVAFEDIEIHMRLRNNLQIKKYLRQVEPCTLEKQKNWFNSLSLNNNSFVFSIFLNNIVIGACNISNIDYNYKNAEVGWFLDPSQHGNGYAKEAVNQLFDYAFNFLQLESLHAYVYTDNDKGNNFVKSLNMIYIGTFQNRRMRNNTFIGENIYQILRKDYYL